MSGAEQRLRAKRLMRIDDAHDILEAQLHIERNSDIKFRLPETRVELAKALEILEDALMHEEMAEEREEGK